MHQARSRRFVETERSPLAAAQILRGPRWRPGTISLIISGLAVMALGALVIVTGEGWLLQWGLG